MSTSIEWTDETWNPVTGCTKVSQGCKHCYAEGVAERFFARQYPPNEDGSPRRFIDVRCHVDRLSIPMHWKRPRMVFVNSMSDLFHEDVPEAFIRAVFTTMRNAEIHTFQVLTKRPERMLGIFRAWQRDGLILREGHGCVLPNVWLGVSVEDQATADQRIPLLLETPARIKFISAEPLLEAIDVYQYLGGDRSPLMRFRDPLDWVICGGESGPGARPFNIEWAHSLLRQCENAVLPFFMKQMGSNVVWPENGRRRSIAMADRKGGDPGEWEMHLRVRQFPDLEALCPSR